MKPILKILVPSKSIKGDWNEVSVYKSGKMECGCLKAMFKQECSHIKLTKVYLREKLWK